MSGDFTFLKGNIETIILCSLYNGHKYGYEIAKEIKERTSNKYEIKQPTLYSYLKRLEEDDLISSYWGENSNGGRRRYYALTTKGRQNCEQFIAEWNYQRSVLSELVDGTANGAEITQEEATPLFGRRSPRRKKSNEYQSEMDEQDEIARRLRELTGAPEESEVVEEPVEEEPVIEEVIIDEPEVVEEQPAPTVIERIVYVDRPVYVEAEKPVEQPIVEQVVPQDESLSRFEVNQDNAEDFMQAFEERAREVSTDRQSNEGENYQHVLMGVIGDQLDGMSQVETTTVATTYYEERHAALEDVADNLAKEGIRLRIYNHATAAYKPKTLIPQAKVLCQTIWLTYVVACIYFGIFALASIAANSWAPFAITLAILLLAPLGVTVYAILDPTRKEKPKFNFRLCVIVASALCLIIILAAVGFSALGNMEFSDYPSLTKQILIPTGIAILLPTFVLIYETLYKQY